MTINNLISKLQDAAKELPDGKNSVLGVIRIYDNTTKNFSIYTDEKYKSKPSFEFELCANAQDVYLRIYEGFDKFRLTSKY